LQIYAVSVPDSAQALMILSEAKGAAEMLGLQETPNDKTVVANLEMFKKNI
jgi:hypothetical protein